MKNGLAWFLCGALLMVPFQAFAEGVAGMVGKAIQGEIPIEMSGKKLEKSAIVIDGTSYVPVRAISETLGLQVDFSEEGIVIRNNSEIETKIINKQREIAEVKGNIQKNNEIIATLKQREIDEVGKTDYFPGMSPKEQLVQRERIGADLLVQLAALEAEKAELEAQLLGDEGK